MEHIIVPTLFQKKRPKKIGQPVHDAESGKSLFPVLDSTPVAITLNVKRPHQVAHALPEVSSRELRTRRNQSEFLMFRTNDRTGKIRHSKTDSQDRHLSAL